MSFASQNSTLFEIHPRIRCIKCTCIYFVIMNTTSKPNMAWQLLLVNLSTVSRSAASEDHCEITAGSSVARFGSRYVDV